MGYITDFVTKYRADAVRASAACGINMSVILAQAALESNWGKSAPHNNFFGIKGPGGTQTTNEYLGGHWTTIQAAFRGYTSPAASFDGYADFINKNPRYARAKLGGTSESQAILLQAAGYATDPHYAQKITTIASQMRAILMTLPDLHALIPEQPSATIVVRVPVYSRFVEYVATVGTLLLILFGFYMLHSVNAGKTIQPVAIHATK